MRFLRRAPVQCQPFVVFVLVAGPSGLLPGDHHCALISHQANHVGPDTHPAAGQCRIERLGVRALLARRGSLGGGAQHSERTLPILFFMQMSYRAIIRPDFFQFLFSRLRVRGLSCRLFVFQPLQCSANAGMESGVAARCDGSR